MEIKYFSPAKIATQDAVIAKFKEAQKKVPTLQLREFVAGIVGEDDASTVTAVLQDRIDGINQPTSSTISS